MAHGDIYEAFMLGIERRSYGKYQIDLDRSDVKRWIVRNFEPNKEQLEELMDAIVTHCRPDKGQPTVSSISWAWDLYRDAHKKPVTRPDWRPDEPTPEEISGRLEIEREARKAGIDTSREGWMFRYITRCALNQEKVSAQ